MLQKLKLELSMRLRIESSSEVLSYCFVIDEMEKRRRLTQD
jgi:hypothetical protein